DVTRGLALVSGAVPVKVSHIQLIEDWDGARIARTAVGLVLARLSGKMRHRVSRGGLQEALDVLGPDAVSSTMGGTRDSEAEFSAWLRQQKIPYRVDDSG
ncbi:unnamed protein product, partial [Polarella glacialis]